MKIIFTLLSIAVFSANLSAQILSQNVTPNVVAATGSYACTADDGTYTKESNYSRVFNLSDYGINYDYKITTISFGVQSVNKPLSVGVYIYNSTGDYPYDPYFLACNYGVNVTPENNGGMVSTAPGGCTIVANKKFVVEVSHNGEAKSEIFNMGTNASLQTGPSYFSSAPCGIPIPIITGTGALSSYKLARWVMTITGVNNLGVTEIIDSKNLQVYPNPVANVLNFKLGNQLEVESLELYDMAGKKLKSVNSKGIKNVNLENFTKGIYVLKVKASDGNIYIQRILKK